MRLFCIWNGAMKPKNVFAETIEQASAMAVKDGHLRKVIGIRKWKDISDHAVETYPGTEEAINLNQSGIGEFTEGQGWVITAVN
jgi:hypothetical protein